MKPRSRRRLLFTLAKIAPFLLLLGLVALQRFLVPVPARSFTVERGAVVQQLFGRGTIESRREAELGFDLVGRISDIRVDEGDRVVLGQVLASLAPEQFTADVRTASKGASLARAAVVRLEAEERHAAATLVFATAEEARARTLATTGVVTARDLDLAVQQLALARAELDRVRATREEVQRQIAVATQTVEVRNVTAARAVLVSPFDGIVIRRLRDPGDTVTVGTTVVRVVATDKLWSRAWVDENALSLLREKQPAQVRVGATGAPTLAGEVDRIGREVDRETHELLVDVLLGTVPKRVAIGQRADVWIEVDRREDVPRVPVSFVRRDAGGIYCWVDRGGRIARRPVTLGLEGTDLVEVTHDLTPGDVVLAAVDPGATLPEGRRWELAETP